MTSRLHVIADGFNLYHSIRDAVERIRQANQLNASASLSHVPQSESMRWLDLRGLCASYVTTIRQGLPKLGHIEIGEVYYFTALARHRGAATVGRHMDYLSALATTDVSVEVARFKRKDIACPRCGNSFSRHEEKETDVAVAARLIEVAATNECEAVLLVSGDTDLLPAIRSARKLCPGLQIAVGFPYLRENHDLAKAADFSFKFNTKKYRKWQLPNPVVLPNGDPLPKPSGW